MSEIFSHILAPVPLLLVLGGATLIALAQFGFAALGPAFGALAPLFTAKPDADRDAARAVLFRAEEIAQAQGVTRVDRLRAHHVFVAEALQKLANAPDTGHFTLWTRRDMADRRLRHARAIGFWNAMADAAPAMGMAGTIIGLIGMFAGMDDPATIGPAMALALMTTLHGMILANMIAGPIANRLARLSEQELIWQGEIADALAAMADRAAATPALAHKSSAREAA